MKNVGDYELIDHGIDNSQYFPGCGVAFTPYSNVVTGCGDNPAEAIEDCLNQIGQCGFDAESLFAQILTDEGWVSSAHIPTEPSASEDCDPDDAQDYGCEVYYYVSLRWNPADSADE